MHQETPKPALLDELDDLLLLDGRVLSGPPVHIRHAKVLKRGPGSCQPWPAGQELLVPMERFQRKSAGGHLVGTGIEVILSALADLARRPRAQVRGHKPLWILGCIVQPLGPVAYLALVVARPDL